MKRIFTFFISSLFLISAGQSQDIHFSQFWNSPLTLGPAQTGNMPCTFRAGVIYRSQWGSVARPGFNTFDASYEHKFDGLWAGDDIGAGFLLYNDRAGESQFNTTYFTLSGAYHKAVGIDHRLSVGLQMGFAQKSFDPNLNFADMYEPGLGFVNSTGENLGDPNMNNFDLNAGLQWTSVITDQLRGYIGASFFHLTSPDDAFMGTFNWPIRTSIYGGVDYKLNEQISVTPKFLFQMMNKATEVVVGSDASYQLTNENFPAKIYGGLFMRYAPGVNGAVDAVYPYVGLGYKDFKFGLSYDVNLSGLTAATGGKGGFEISLLYCGIIEAKPVRVIVPCLRF